MQDISKDIAIRRITEMSTEQVSKVLIFMAGMEAEQTILEKNSDTFYKSLGAGMYSVEFSKI
ncbi:MAG: hypothetical protein HFH34_02325 [Eubacterium sp.]|nr:hypothetical protein [Eubacterium sp.]